MTLIAMSSYRAVCDEPDCETYINFAVPQGAAIPAVLAFHRWWTEARNGPAEILCPKHKPEGK